MSVIFLHSTRIQSEGVIQIGGGQFRYKPTSECIGVSFTFLLGMLITSMPRCCCLWSKARLSGSRRSRCNPLSYERKKRRSRRTPPSWSRRITLPRHRGPAAPSTHPLSRRTPGTPMWDLSVPYRRRCHRTGRRSGWWDAPSKWALGRHSGTRRGLLEICVIF